MKLVRSPAGRQRPTALLLLCLPAERGQAGTPPLPDLPTDEQPEQTRGIDDLRKMVRDEK